MFVGLLLRSLQRWLQEHIGVDINQSEYNVEWLGSSHVCVKLRDVALTSALWRFVVGSTLPLTVHSGTVSEVRVDISTEELSIFASGVSLRLQEVPLERWPAEAEAYCAKLRKDKEFVLSGCVQEGEIKRWVKSKLRVSVSSLMAVLQSSGESTESCKGACLAVACSSLTVGPLPQQETTALDRRGNDLLLLMAKVCAASNLRLFLAMDQQPIGPNWPIHFESNVAQPEHVLATAMQIKATYRTWMPDALQKLPEVALLPNKTLLLQARAEGQTKAEEAVSIKIGARGFSYLMKLGLAFDSLCYAWLSLLQASASNINGTPTHEEALKYIQNWHCHQGNGGRDWLQELESRLSPRFVERLRYLARTVDVNDTVNVVGDRMPLTDLDLSPRIPAHVYETLSEAAKVSLAPLSPSAGTSDVQFPLALDGTLSENARVLSDVSAAFDQPPMEFAAEAAYQIVMPNVRLLVDLRSERVFETLQDETAELHIESSDLAVCYVRNLDSKYISAKSAHVRLMSSSKSLLDWKAMHYAIESFGAGCRDMIVRGQLTTELRRVLPFLWLCPGLRPVVPLNESVQRWFAGQTPPAKVEDLLLRVSKPLFKTAFHLSFPQMSMTLSPKGDGVVDAPDVGFSESASSDGQRLPRLCFTAVNLELRRDLRGNLTSRLFAGQLLCMICSDLPRPELPILSVGNVETPTSGPLSTESLDAGAGSSGIASTSPLAVTVGALNVNMSSFLLHVLVKHRGAYSLALPASWNSGVVEMDKSRQGVGRGSIQANLDLENVEVCVWGLACGASTSASTPPLRDQLRGRISGLRVATAQSQSLPDAACKFRLEVDVRGYLVDALWGGGVRGVIACSGLEDDTSGGAADGSTRGVIGSPAFSGSLCRGELGVLEATIKSASVHLALLPGLLKRILLLFPGLFSVALPADDPRRLGYASTPPTTGLCSLVTLDPADEFDETGAAARIATTLGRENIAVTNRAVSEVHNENAMAQKFVLKMDHLLLGLHFMPAGACAPLLWVRDLEETCSARPAAERLSLIINAQRLCAQLTRRAHLEVHLDSAQISTVQTFTPAGKMPHAWSVVLESVDAITLLSSANSGSGVPQILSSGAFSLRVRTASLWATHNDTGRSSVQVSDAYSICNAPSIPGVRGVVLHNLLMPRFHREGGMGAWLTFAINGAYVEHCPGLSGKKVEGFYALEPRLLSGYPVYRHPSTGLFLYRTRDSDWAIAANLEHMDASSQPAGSEAACCSTCHPRSVIEPSWGSNGNMLLLLFAPTVVSLRRTDVGTLRNMVRCCIHLSHDLKVMHKPPAKKASHPDDLALAFGVGGRVIMNLDFSVHLPEHPACPALRLQCTPGAEGQIPKTLGALFFEFKAISVEVLQKDLEKSEVPPGMSPLPWQSLQNDWTTLLRLSFQRVSARVARAPKLCAISVDALRGEYRTNTGNWSTFLRPGDTALNLNLLYESDKQLLVHVAPMALLLQKDWLTPILILTGSVRSWYRCCGNAWAEAVVGDPMGESVSISREETTWEGPVWILPACAGTHIGDCCQRNEFPRRAWVEVNTAGEMWDVTDETRPEMLSAYIKDACIDTHSPPGIGVDIFPWRFHVALNSVIDSKVETFVGQMPMESLRYIAVDSEAEFNTLFPVRAPPKHSNSEDWEGASCRITGTQSSLETHMRSCALTRQPSTSTGRRWFPSTPTSGRSAATAVATAGAGVGAALSPLLTPMVRTLKRMGARRESPVCAAASSRQENESSNLGFGMDSASMKVDIALKGVDVWLPTSIDGGKSNASCVGFMFIAEATGTYGGIMKAEVPLLRVVRACSGSWETDGASDDVPGGHVIMESFAGILDPTAWVIGGTRSPPWVSPDMQSASPISLPFVAAPHGGRSQPLATFLQYELAKQSEQLAHKEAGCIFDARTCASPGSKPAIEQPGTYSSETQGQSLAASRMSESPQHATKHAKQSNNRASTSVLCNAYEDVLMDTSGLDFAVIWGIQQILGVRMKRVNIRIPIDLVQIFSKLRDDVAELVCILDDASRSQLHATRSEDPLKLGVFSEELLHRTTSSPLLQLTPKVDDDVARKSSEATLSSASVTKMPPRAGTSKSINMMTWLRTVGTKAVSPYRTSDANNAGSSESSVPVAPSGTFSQTVMEKEIQNASSTEKAAMCSDDQHIALEQTQAYTPWKLELEVAGCINVTLAGGLLAPAHWLQAEVSEILIWGTVPPRQGVPTDTLSGTFRCDVMCYDAASAVLEPVLEPVEVSVDIRKSHGPSLLCKAATTRVNLNIQKVLVDFLFAVHRGLQGASGEALVPIWRFDVLNDTGVVMDIKWPDSFQATRLPSGQFTEPKSLKGGSVRSILLRVDLDGTYDEVRIALDHTQPRAYMLGSTGCPIIVEPDNDIRSGHCTLRILSAVTIHNHTAVPLSIMLDPVRPAGFIQATEALLSALNPIYGAHRPPHRRLCVAARHTARVPLSWFSRQRQLTWIKPEMGGVQPSDMDEPLPDLPPEDVVGASVAELGSTPGDDDTKEGSASVAAARATAVGNSASFTSSRAVGGNSGGYADPFLARAFPQLSKFLIVGDSGKENDMEDSSYSSAGLLDGAGGAVAGGAFGNSGEGLSGTWMERMKFALFFHRYMKIVGYVDVAELPMGGEHDDQRPMKTFVMHLGDVVSIRNMLPFPIVLQLCAASNVLEAHPFPSACAREALAAPHSVEARLIQASSAAVEANAEGAEGAPPPHRDIPSFVVENETGVPRLRWWSELDGILQLTLGYTQRRRRVQRKCPGDMVASYVLGVDEEVSLPLAKRSLHLRIIAATESGGPGLSSEIGTWFGCGELEEGTMTSFRPPNKSRICMSCSEQIYLPSSNAHLPRTQPVVLMAQSSADNHTEHTHGSFRSCDRLDVSLEMTRNTIILFAPVVVENLTPCFLRIHPSDDSCLLGPMSRRLLPGMLCRADVAYFELCDFAELDDENQVHCQSHSKGQTLKDVSDLNKVQQLLPMAVPASCPSACGFFQDQLAFGACVRTGAPPLRLTKVLSVFPRFSVQSQLDSDVHVRFCDAQGAMYDVADEQCGLLVSGSRLTVHPPRAVTASGSPIRICILECPVSDAEPLLSCSAPFEIEPQDSEGRVIFNVRLANRSAKITSTCDISGSGSDVYSARPRFIQVDINHAVLLGKENVPFPCGGQFVMLRPQNFRGSGDALIHIQNSTRHPFYFQVGGHADSVSSKAVDVHPVNAGEHCWVHKVGFEDDESRYKIMLSILHHEDRNGQSLCQVDLGTALMAKPGAVVMRFVLRARLQLTASRDHSETELAAAGKICLSKGSRFEAHADGSECAATKFGKVDHASMFEDVIDVELILADRSSQSDVADVHIVGLGKNSSSFEWLSDRWRLVAIDGKKPLRGAEWKTQIRAARRQVLWFEARFEGRHVEGNDGVQHFKLQGFNQSDDLGDDWAIPFGPLASSGNPAGHKNWQFPLELQVVVPVVSVSWVHRRQEVLALKVRHMDLRVAQDRSGDMVAEFGAQHMQVDHFVNGEMPVMLNRRFLHINSRWLGKNALWGKARWVMASRMIKDVQIELVPYWMNLEMGVLIRLWDLAEGSFSFLNNRAHKLSISVPLEPPQPPRASVDDKDLGAARVWRLMRLVVRPLRLTVHVRSPDIDAATDNPTARWIMRLPTDMPNMDMFLPLIMLKDRYGSLPQLAGALKEKYKRRIKYSFTLSIIISYLAAILKALINALMWLGRGPMDSVTVAYRHRASDANGANVGILLWWVSPFLHGSAEGTYRALAELVGNIAFSVVFFLNTLRHCFVGTARPRVQSLLDGLAYGFRGVFVDILSTPFMMLWLQTQKAYQDWGPLTAFVVFFLSLLRIPMGAIFGVLNFIACSLEGLANVLLHEEAQFANFEPQRSTEPVPLFRRSRNNLRSDVPMELIRAASGMSVPDKPHVRDTRALTPKPWYPLQRSFERMRSVARLVMDDDEVMDLVQQQANTVFNAGGA